MMLGIISLPLGQFADNRVLFTDIMRKDWMYVFQDDVFHANISLGYPGIAGAWHKHERGKINHLLALRGTLRFCTYDDETHELDESASIIDNPQMIELFGYWHGFKVVGNNSAKQVHVVNRACNYRELGETRCLWDDLTIISQQVNNKPTNTCSNLLRNWFCPPQSDSA